MTLGLRPELSEIISRFNFDLVVKIATFLNIFYYVLTEVSETTLVLSL